MKVLQIIRKYVDDSSINVSSMVYVHHVHVLRKERISDVYASLIDLFSDDYLIVIFLA